MNRIFLNANILIDFLSDKAEPEDELNARLIIEYCFEYLGKAYTSTHAIMILYHMVEKEFVQVSVLKERLEEVRSLLNIITIENQDFDYAFQSYMDDFEDAVQLSCAIKSNADLIITKDIGDFFGTTIPIFPPDQFFDFI